MKITTHNLEDMENSETKSGKLSGDTVKKCVELFDQYRELSEKHGNEEAFRVLMRNVVAMNQGMDRMDALLALYVGSKYHGIERTVKSEILSK